MFWLKTIHFQNSPKMSEYLSDICKKLSQRPFNNLVTLVETLLTKFFKCGQFLGEALREDQSGIREQCDQKKSPNVYKSCPKMITLEK